MAVLVVWPPIGRADIPGVCDRLARAVADAAFAEIRRQLHYKTLWNGGMLAVADRWFPSSKTCSGCQALKTKLPLRTRTFTCETCGLVIDRDANAALNLAALMQRHVAGSGPETINGRGADQKTRQRLAGGATPRHGRNVHPAPGANPGRTGTFAR